MSKNLKRKLLARLIARQNNLDKDRAIVQNTSLTSADGPRKIISAMELSGKLKNISSSTTRSTSHTTNIAPLNLVTHLNPVNSNSMSTQYTNLPSNSVKHPKTNHKVKASSTITSHTPKQLSKLQNKFADKLSGAQFRWLNESLYTTSSTASFDRFQESPSLFTEYHAGYRKQVESWPENPLDHMISFCRAQVVSAKAHVCIGDFGCGEARLAAELMRNPGRDKVSVHSFDLVAANTLITACDIAHTPLEDSKLDIAIFSLSLMGTNFLQFIREAHRTLRPGYIFFHSGFLEIAEVQSRFESVERFVETVEDIGFKATKQDGSNGFFILFRFFKTALSHASQLANSAKSTHKRKHPEHSISVDDAPLLLKACKYKKR